MLLNLVILLYVFSSLLLSLLHYFLYSFILLLLNSLTWEVKSIIRHRVVVSRAAVSFNGARGVDGVNLSVEDGRGNEVGVEDSSCSEDGVGPTWKLLGSYKCS